MMLLNSVCVLLSSYLAIVEAAAVPATPPASYSSSSSCTNPSKRPEWRALSQAQKTTYIKAVQCLTTKPSRLGLKTSLYEDFAYVHAHLNTESKSTHTNTYICSSYPFLIHHHYMIDSFPSPLQRQIPSLASLLHLHLRIRPPQRLHLHRPLPLLGLGTRQRRTEQIPHLVTHLRLRGQWQRDRFSITSATRPSNPLRHRRPLQKSPSHIPPNHSRTTLPQPRLERRHRLKPARWNRANARRGIRSRRNGEYHSQNNFCRFLAGTREWSAWSSPSGNQRRYGPFDESE